MKSAWRIFALLVLSALALQLYFLARVALMVVVDPQSTSFQRSEAWRLLTEKHALAWRQQWAPYDRIAQSLKRAVIASEDAGFAEHSGIEWDALEKAWERNQKAEARVEKINQIAVCACSGRRRTGCRRYHRPSNGCGSWNRRLSCRSCHPRRPWRCWSAAAS